MRMLLTLCAVVSMASFAAAQSPLRFHERFDTAPEGGTLVDGKWAGAVAPPSGGIRIASSGRLDKRRGTLCFWLKPNFDGQQAISHGLLADELEFNRIGGNNLYLWHWSTGALRFDVRDPKDSYVTFDVRSWKAGQWHHVAAAWDASDGLWLFVDGALVARRKAAWEPKTASHFRIGSDSAGGTPADAAFDDLRIYDRVLDAGQIARVMQGESLPQVEYKGIAAPSGIVEGKPFNVRLDWTANDPLPAKAEMAVSLGDFLLGVFPLGEQAAVSVPRYLHLGAGTYPLRAKIVGALADTESPECTVQLDTPDRPESPRFTRLEGTVCLNDRPLVAGDAGLLVDGVFYEGEAARQKAAELDECGALLDAVPCRRLDRVDCATTSHGFEETSPSRLVELAPGKRFRICGPADAVEQTRHIWGADRRILPAYSYRLKTQPRPAPHLLVVESINDMERNLEVAVDVAPGSRPAAILGQSGLGSPRLINLAVVCSGREFPADGKPFRQAFLFYPKSDAITVTIAASGRELEKVEAPGSAVSEMAVYEFTRPLAELVNPIQTPDNPRHLALFYPEVMLSFSEYGFSGATGQQRRASVRSMFDYLRFLGFDRLEFHPYAFRPEAHFDSKLYKSAGEYDVFDDILPVADGAGIGIVPRMDSLCFYGEVWKDAPLNYQLTKDGKTPDVFGACPDPLRPPVQKLLLDMLGDILDRCEGAACVSGVGFRANAKFGVLYVGNSADMPPQESGYSEWDIEQFERDAGVKVPVAHDTPAACYEWLRANAWERWIAWRCDKMHDWWLAARDLARSHGRELHVRTVIPYSHHFPSEKTQWYGQKRSPLEMCCNHGFDPRLFVGDAGLLTSEYFSLGADRYNRGRIHNRAWWHDPRLDGLIRTADGAEVELYYIYWELPTHPGGFRVGPSHMAGRAAFEPLTYAMRTRNPKSLIFYNWHRATSGVDVELRRFARAYRALPAVEPQPFTGPVEPASQEKLWLRWFDDRLALVNDKNEPCSVSLTWPNTIPAGCRLVDLATMHTLAQADGEPAAGPNITIDLLPFDLHTLAILETER